MYWLIGFIVVWLCGTGYMLGYDIWYYRKNPWAESRREEGLISLSKRQQRWIMALWPFALIGFVIYYIGMVIWLIGVAVLQKLRKGK